MEKCGVPMTAEAVSEVIKEFDADHDGSLNFQEFISMMNKMTSGPSEKDIRKSMFEVFDGNMDGFITVAEVRREEERARAPRRSSRRLPPPARSSSPSRRGPSPRLSTPLPSLRRSYAQLVAAWKKAAAESGGALDVPSEAVLANLIQEADQDGDGQLSEDEFLQLVEQCS